jgi:hypothetical protein
MSARFLENDRLADLLVALETEGLGEHEAAELDRLLADEPSAPRDGLAGAASATLLAARIPLQPLPASLHGRLVEQGRARVRDAAAAKVVKMPRRDAEPAASVSSAGGSRLGWYAAAASLLLAVASWWPRLSTEVPAPMAQAPAEPTYAEKRQQLIESGSPVVQVAWSGTEDPASQGVQGDVVWDEAKQTGYMRFTGLAANDPVQEQYQLWIFDATRDDRYPVDGGVFDIPAGGDEVVVPITAGIPVREPALFAVTVEKPGGVVVSSRERIVAVAQVAAG